MNDNTTVLASSGVRVSHGRPIFPGGPPGLDAPGSGSDPAWDSDPVLDGAGGGAVDAPVEPALDRSVERSQGGAADLEALARQLRLERDALRETFDVIDDALYLYDDEGRLHLQNSAALRLRAETASPDHPLTPEASYFFEGSDGVGEQSLSEILLRLARQAISKQQAADGGLTRAGRHFEARAHPVAGRRALVYIRDVTEGRDTEVRRLQSAKLAAIGMLAAGMAHEINNPASFVLANTEALGGMLRVLDEKLRADPLLAARLGVKEMLFDLLFEAMAIVQESKEGMARIQRIVRDLHSFSRVDDDPGDFTDVNAAVDSALTMLRNELRYRAQVERRFQASRPVRGSSARLGQVFLNLIANAAQALPEGRLKHNRIVVRSYDRGDQVVIEVEDNGPGIPPEILPRIFDSFFTTKPAGVGTGLGLSISREIVRAAGGEITADQFRSEGALFRVRLPAITGAPGSAAGPGPRTSRRRHRLLAIDDEVLLLKAYRRMLIDHHDVELAYSGGEALALLERDRRFDVILCDLQMPELSGADVYRAVAERWPGLEQRFIIITGGAFSAEARRFIEEGAVTCLNKPFQLNEILEIIDRRAASASRR
jgi:signal transduction histidine kinase/CheY-like chemotaxis protein